jgi:transaldolase/glucose-6-phosphate isomerase
VNPTAENEATILALAARLAVATGCVVTHGFGPRYLHSTGQLHKGGPDSGRFLQVVEDYGAELEIPGQPFGFARLIRAQAAGDFESLRERGRRVARVRLEEIETAKEG